MIPNYGFECPYCGAKPGNPCKTKSGIDRDKPHKNRPQSVVAFEKLENGRRRDAQGGVPAPLPDLWKGAFVRSTLKTGFCLALSQPMLECLCAIADEVKWDRFIFRHSMGRAVPDSWIVTANALERRGLVQHRGTQILMEEDRNRSIEEICVRYRDGICDTYELTPAGKKLVELLKMTGVFIQQTAAMNDNRGVVTKMK